MTYQIHDRPPIGKLLLGAFQQLLAILAATIAVPAIVGNGMSQAAALFGAGVGTLVYLAFTKLKSPVFLGSSFAFLGSMAAAFAGATSAALGYLGLIIGAAFAALVYVVLAVITKFCGTRWINRIMPTSVIGPTVAIIGLSLAANAVGDIMSAGYKGLLCGLVALFVIVITSVYGNKNLKLIPFIVGIAAGYLVALCFGLVKIPEYSWMPQFTFVEALKGTKELTFGYILTIAIAYVPVAFVVFAEHIADHVNLSSIIGTDLLKDPGLHRTLMGDGVGSFFGALFGGCPNTTYGESISCVAISGNASVWTTATTAFMAIIASFIGPFVAVLASIPACVLAGACFMLYGYIAVSGLKMIQKVDLNRHSNLFTVASILVAGVGGLTLTFGQITLTSVACALILGIMVNFIGNFKFYFTK